MPRFPEVLCRLFDNSVIILLEAAVDAAIRSLPMVHDLVLALVFLAMIIAPAILAMRSDREEKDIL
jgi:hypothetical protein